MPIYLIIAYVVFCAVPLGLALSITMRKRRVQKGIAALQAQRDTER